MQGRVFNIQRFSINDGPGIRTSVFVKGCNLRCLWCHNPESNLPHQEIQYFPQKCVRCGECIRVCPTGAHYINALDEKIFDRGKCDLCGECVTHCMYDALVFTTRYLEPEEVVAEVIKDLDYYRNSGGGLTISGGEPLLQKEFVREVFDLTKTRGIHNALDTALNVRWADLEYVLPSTDLVLLDLKAMDSAAHKRGTGVENRRILDNAVKLSQRDVDLIIRIPVVPGINGSDENMSATAEFVKDFQKLLYIELLPYHDMGVDKYTSLGRLDRMAVFDIPSAETMKSLARIFEECNIPVRIN